MRRPRPVATSILAATIGLAPLAGCGRRDQGARTGELTFEQLSDTTGISSGAPLLQDFDAYRMENGALRVKGHARLPEGTNLHVAVKRAGERGAIRITQVTVHDGAFDSAPLIGDAGPLP